MTILFGEICKYIHIHKIHAERNYVMMLPLATPEWLAY